MVEVLNSNFEEMFPEVEQAIRQADFIAVDTEFSGLNIDADHKSSLFDSMEERYQKLRGSFSKFVITQIGISAFTKDPSDNKYVAKTYNFYLYPPSFGPVDASFMVQASSFDFLRKYNFDFNKFVYDGISYLNEEQIQKFKDYMTKKVAVQGVERDIDEELIQDICSEVADWYINSNYGDIHTISKESVDVPNVVLHTELRGRFPNVWTKFDFETGCINVEKVTDEDREESEKKSRLMSSTRDDRLLHTLLGFTRVFNVMKECKKPLLGHNMLIDLVLIFNSFHKPLPNSYQNFKTELHSVFPVVYDTKHISSTLRSKMQGGKTSLLHKTSLNQLYQKLNSHEGQQHVIHTPVVLHADGHDRYENQDKPHEAGWDAYMCGYVFLRLSHIHTFAEMKSTEVIPCSFRRYLQEMSTFTNKINLMRGRTHYLSLDKPDEESMRPMLFLQSRKYSYNLDANQLAHWFSPYGSVDIQLQSKRRALVVTDHIISCRHILRDFEKHELVYVTKYNKWKHSPMIRNLLMAGTLVSGGLCILAMVNLSSRKNS